MREISLVSVVLVFFVLAIPVSAEGKVREHSYSIGNVKFQGYIASPEGLDESRPGVLIVHQWKGITDYERRRARQLAGLGYVAFTADI